MENDKQVRVDADSLRRFVEEVFCFHGVPEQDAVQAADVLLASDLRGIDSHGVSRLYHYCDQLATGRVCPTPTIRIVREKSAAATIDGDNGLGLVVGPWANRLAIAKAEQGGAAWVVVRNSNHFGIAGYYPLCALERDCLGWAMTNASALVAPLWSRERMLGTNPIAVAFPGKREPPVVIDMATSAVAFGKVKLAQQRGESIPDGWAVDHLGNWLRNPEEFDRQSSLAPLGGNRQTGGHKGYALGALVDLFCGVLSGACWGPFAPMFYDLESRGDPRHGIGLGHCFGAMQIEAFADIEDLKERVDAWIARFRKAAAAKGTSGPLIPGDPEREEEQNRKAAGIPLHQEVREQLNALSHRTGAARPTLR